MPKQAKMSDRTKLPASKGAHDLGLRLMEAIDEGAVFLEGIRRYPRIAAGQGMEGLRRVFREEDARRAAQRLRDLRRRGHAKEKRVGRRLLLVLTDKGRLMKLRFQIRSAPRRRDKKRLIVAFDIPERDRALRRTLRVFLRSCGFTRLQHSVWVTDRDACAPLGAWLQHLRRESDWIRLFLGEEH